MGRESDTSRDFPTPAPAGVFLSLYDPSDGHLDFLAEILRQEQLVAVPSETVYGLAAKATAPAACAKIFALKKRPTFDPLIVHVRSLEQARDYAYFDPLALRLAQTFWPGPLTIVLKKKEAIPSIVTSGKSTVALRCPAHPIFQALLHRLDFGLAAPSANPFGYISPTTAEHVAESFGTDLPYILDGGPCRIGLESTIVDASEIASRGLRILRHGGVDEEELKRFLREQGTAPEELIDATRSSSVRKGEPAIIDAPGMLNRHYSPQKPLELVPFGQMDPVELRDRRDVAYLLASTKPVISHELSNCFLYLSAHNSTDPGHHLYRFLREIDQGPWERIVAELPPGDIRHSAAIRDRLTRAAARD
jgi:L-threonylcarbamoyladenylate synthase